MSTRDANKYSTVALLKDYLALLCDNPIVYTEETEDEWLLLQEQKNRVFGAIRQIEPYWCLESPDSNDICAVCGLYAAGIGFNDRYWRRSDEHEERNLCDDCYEVLYDETNGKIEAIRMND